METVAVSIVKCSIRRLPQHAAFAALVCRLLPKIFNDCKYLFCVIDSERSSGKVQICMYSICMGWLVSVLRLSLGASGGGQM